MLLFLIIISLTSHFFSRQKLLKLKANIITPNHQILTTTMTTIINRTMSIAC